MDTIESRVRRGATRLDGYDPEWRRHVDISRLNLTSRTDCPLGQRFGGFMRGVTALGLTDSSECESHGFLAGATSDFFVKAHELDQLREAWVNSVQQTSVA